jgi:predicted O-linked N-acetylglucosamine transferase (SPINDLY family)
MMISSSYQGLNDRILMEALHTLYLSLCPELEYVAPGLTVEGWRPVDNAKTIRPTDGEENLTEERNAEADAEPDLPKSKSGERQLPTIQVGLISTHFRDHSIGRILIRMIQEMQLFLKVEVFVVLMDPRTGKGGTEDGITNGFSQILGGQFLRVSTNPFQARRVVEALRLDVLIYADLGMDFDSYQLAFSRLAPIQAAWWGHVSDVIWMCHTNTYIYIQQLISPL